MVQVLHRSLLQVQEPLGRQDLGGETSVHNELAEVGGFAESDRRRFSEGDMC